MQGKYHRYNNIDQEVKLHGTGQGKCGHCSLYAEERRKETERTGIALPGIITSAANAAGGKDMRCGLEWKPGFESQFSSFLAVLGELLSISELQFSFLENSYTYIYFSYFHWTVLRVNEIMYAKVFCSLKSTMKTISHTLLLCPSLVYGCHLYACGPLCKGLV